MPTENHTVLVVDDDDDNATLLGMLVDQAGWRAVYAATLSEARIALAREPDIDAIVTDVCLPDGSGLTLLERGRPDSLRAAIAVSGLQRGSERRESARVGFDEYLLKPFDGTYLVALLRQLFRDESQPS